jgi:low affinity Fe/Cu permease
MMDMLDLKRSILLFIGVLFLQKVHGQDVNELITRLNQTKSSSDQYELYTQIGLEYQKQQAYKKSLEYFQKAYTIHYCKA